MAKKGHEIIRNIIDAANANDSEKLLENLAANNARLKEHKEKRSIRPNSYFSGFNDEELNIYVREIKKVYQTDTGAERCLADRVAKGKSKIDIEDQDGNSATTSAASDDHEDIQTTTTTSTASDDSTRKESKKHKRKKHSTDDDKSKTALSNGCVFTRSCLTKSGVIAAAVATLGVVVALILKYMEARTQDKSNGLGM